MKRYIKYLIIFWLLFIGLVVSMGITRHVLLGGSRIKETPKEIVVFLSALASNLAHYKIFSNPLNIFSRLTLKNGFNHNAKYQNSEDYLLVFYWNDSLSQPAVKLLRISDGKILYDWKPNIEQLIQKFNTGTIYGVDNRLNKSITTLRHPFLLNNGSLLFSAGGLCKIDKDSKIVWVNPTVSHHSLEQDAEGNFWICSYNSSSANSEKYQIKDDAIKKISPSTGEVLYEKSVFEILMENGYRRGYFFINPEVTTGISYLDYTHLNDVQPVLEDSKFWKKGDLFLSLRHQNLVLQFRPSTGKIIWSQNGPWLRQHNVDIIDSTHIGIFGNNVIDAKFENEDDRLIDGHNTQYIYDFENNELSTPYDTFFEKSHIRTFTEGRSRVLENGDIFVEETNHGRILFGNKTEEFWTYIDRIDENHVSMFGWSRYITAEEFKKLTFITTTQQ